MKNNNVWVLISLLVFNWVVCPFIIVQNNIKGILCLLQSIAILKLKYILPGITAWFLFASPRWVDHCILDGVSSDYPMINLYYLIHARLIKPHYWRMGQFVKHCSQHSLAIQSLVTQEDFLQEFTVEHCASNVIQN